MTGRFDYVKYDDQSAVMQAAFKEHFLRLELLADSLNDGRAKSLMLTHLEEAYAWVGKAIRDAQIDRGGDAKDRPERGT